MLRPAGLLGCGGEIVTAGGLILASSEHLRVFGRVMTLRPGTLKGGALVLLETSGLSKNFGGLAAVSDLSFQ